MKLDDLLQPTHSHQLVGGVQKEDTCRENAPMLQPVGNATRKDTCSISAQKDKCLYGRVN